MQIISLAEVLQAMDSTAEPFDLVFTTADRKRKTGGELVALAGCVKTGGPHVPKTAPAPVPAGNPAPATPGRNPQHRVHQTVNVTVLSSGKVKTVHVRLITEFNGQKVRW